MDTYLKDRKGVEITIPCLEENIFGRLWVNWVACGSLGLEASFKLGGCWRKGWGAVWVAKIGTALAVRVSWTTPLAVALISIVGVNSGDGEGGAWSDGAFFAGAGKAGRAEISGYVFPHES